VRSRPVTAFVGPSCAVHRHDDGPAGTANWRLVEPWWSVWPQPGHRGGSRGTCAWAARRESGPAVCGCA